MAISRYDLRTVLKNATTDYSYSKIFMNRGVGLINQFDTAELKYPSPEDIAEEFTLETEIWAIGTKYFRLASEYYNDPEYWWIIAWFNMRPLETDFSPGDVVTIPTPLESVLDILGLT